MNLALVLLTAYSVGVVGLGLWTSRLIRQSSDFFVASRSLGPGLVFASMLAANVGAGATVGVAGLAYRDGLSAWWWSGSAGIGSIALAFWVGPRLWRLAKDRGFYTTGDFLEYRYGSTVRGVVTVLIWLGSLSILAAQLLAGATILNVITGLPRWAGSLIGGAIMTAYFAAGGLLGSSWVNTLQLLVMVGGFAIAVPAVVGSAGGLSAMTSASGLTTSGLAPGLASGLASGLTLPEGFGSFGYSSGPGSGWTLLLLVGPAFVVSPGLIQKAYGAASERALKIGVGLNAIGLMLFAFAPVLLGMAARVLQPDIADPNAVLPYVLTRELSPWLGAIALSAVFSTEVDTCDAVLFMLSTSLSQDLYKRHINPGASDRRLLMVARLAAVGGGAAGVLFSIWLPTVVEGLSIFYSLLGVTLLVPVVAGLFIRRAGAPEALASIAAGVLTWLSIRYFVTGQPWIDPTLMGLIAAAAAFFVVLGVGRARGPAPTKTS